MIFFFVTVGFVYSRCRSTVTDGVCRHTPHSSFFSCTFKLNQMCILTAWLWTSHPMCLCARFIPSSCHQLVASSLSFFCFSPSFTSSLPHSTCTLPSTSSPMSTAPRETAVAPLANEEYFPMAIYHPLTRYWICGRMTKFIEHRNQYTIGQMSGSSTLTLSRTLTSAMMHILGREHFTIT